MRTQQIFSSFNFDRLSSRKQEGIRLAAMQPYFFPYLGQFDLLNKANLWIAHDQLQYIRHGWVNRNRILHPQKGWEYIIVPIKKHDHTAPISQIEIADQLWKEQIFRQFACYNPDAPYYYPIIQFLEDLLSNEETNLAKLNVACFRAVARFIGIQTPIYLFSEMGLDFEQVSGAENIALSLCKAVNADEYINPPGGAALYSTDTFNQHGIRLTIQTFEDMIYPCGRFQFLPSLSILDILMWNSPQEIKQYLDHLYSGGNPPRPL